MDVTTGYSIGHLAQSTTTLPTTLTTSETALYTILDQQPLKQSQLSIYLTVTLGGVTSATFYYYYSTDGGTTWNPISLYNTTTGEMIQRSVLIDSGTYATGGVSSCVDNVPLAACTGFRITGKSASGTPVYTVKVMVRNN